MRGDPTVLLVTEPTKPACDRAGEISPPQSVFEAEVAPHLRGVFRFLVARLGVEEDARDALQETLLAAWQKRDRVRDRTIVRPWLYGIATNKARDVYRRRARQPVPAELPVELIGEVSTDGHDLLAGLDGLSQKDREVLLLRYLVGLTERETATALGVRIGTVKSRSARATTRLSVLLGEDQADG